MTSIERGTVVVLTHNRRVRLLQTLRALSRLPDDWPIIVVDNGSSDGTSDAVSKEFPAVLLIRSRRNIGAAARNIAVAYAHTPYVAFCDDDTQWQPGSLQRAAVILDNHPRIGIVNGCLLVGEQGRVHPSCVKMAESPLDREGLPGPQLLDFMAGASVVRTRAFYEAGGYWPPLFFDGEESLLALDLAERGWRIVYMEDVVLRRAHTCLKTSDEPIAERRRWRNAIWVAWMRLPANLAWRETLTQLKDAAEHSQLRAVMVHTLGGAMRVLRERHVVTPRVAAMRSALFARAAIEARSTAAAAANRSVA